MICWFFKSCISNECENLSRRYARDTLGAMITCDFDALTANFDAFYQVGGR
jgi:hypothetical protein